MSSNPNHTINLSNYEEWLVLYMDNELSADDKAAVESFLLLHPQLQEELDVLLSTKLPADDVAFIGKESLKAETMKLNMVDESLLLYLDNELSAAEKKAVEEKTAADSTLRLQYKVLKQTKLDASEIISYPNKKELYRHNEKVIFFPTWMRVAVAVVLILFATFFFVINKGNTATPDQNFTKTDAPVKKQNDLPKKESIAPSIDYAPVLQQSTASTKTEKRNKPVNVVRLKTNDVLPQKQSSHQGDIAIAQPEETPLQKTELAHIDVKKLTEQPVAAINISTANPIVTSITPASLKQQDNPEATADAAGEFNTKKGSARGLLRKVSRFISHRTGIGTASADNETLVGMVALKLN